VRAGCSVPGIFEPAVLNGRVLVDGVLMADVPIAAARNLGADRVIGVALNADTPQFPPQKNIVDVLSDSFQILTRGNYLRSLEGADIVIAPHLSGFGYQDLSRVEELVSLGEATARRVLGEARRRFLEGHWLRRGNRRPVEKQ
jgi:NTE family protein